jgi:hypothetical protein
MGKKGNPLKAMGFKNVRQVLAKGVKVLNKIGSSSLGKKVGRGLGHEIDNYTSGSGGGAAAPAMMAAAAAGGRLLKAMAVRRAARKMRSAKSGGRVAGRAVSHVVVVRRLGHV